MSRAPKTRPTRASVADFLAAQPDPVRRADCLRLQQLMTAATGAPAEMWGDAIVGFGRRDLRYADGSTLDWPVVAFSPRKGDISVYLMDGFDRMQPQISRLGKFKTGKVCLYIRRLADVDVEVLDELVQLSVAALAPRPPLPAESAE